MSHKWIGIFIGFLFLVLGVVFLLDKEEDFRVITLPSIYSIYQTDDTERFYVKVLTNDSDSYHFSQDLISQVTIFNESDILSLNIKDIQKYENEYKFQDFEYHLVSFELVPDFTLIEGEIHIENAMISLRYENGESMDLTLGSFHLFARENSSDLSLNNVYVTHGDIEGVDTTTGLYINLHNRTDQNIIIKRIETYGSVLFDNYMMQDIEKEVLHNDAVSDVLNIDEYNHNREGAVIDQDFLLIANNDDDYYVPLLYPSDISFLYRFPVIVVYEIDGREKEYIIDDFPYINTSFFKQELERWYVVHDQS